MKLTAAEKAQIKDQRARTKRRAKALRIRGSYRAGDTARNDAREQAGALALYEDCNAPSQFDMCWDCAHCLRVRAVS